MRLYFVRHGQTWFNVWQRLQGWSDMPLTATGLADAKRAGALLKGAVTPDAIVASDLKRAQDTADIINQVGYDEQFTVVPQAAFREVYFGYFEGQSMAVLQDVFANETTTAFATDSDLAALIGEDVLMDKLAEADTTQQAENAVSYWQRITQGLADLQVTYGADATIIIVAHGAVIRKLANRYEPMTFHHNPNNGAVSEWDYDGQTLTLLNYNWTGQNT